MPYDPVQLLLVMDRDGDVNKIRAQLDGATDPGFELQHVRRACDAIEQLKSRHFDIILLDMAVADSSGLNLVEEFHDAAGGAPLVVLGATGDGGVAEAVLRSGADDFVTTDQLRGRDVARSIHHALLRHEHAMLHEEARRLRRLTHMVPIPVVSRIYGSGPLRTTVSSVFATMVAEYGELLDVALEERMYRVDRGLSVKSSALADRLGVLRAGPRDVVDVHVAALNEKRQHAPKARSYAYGEESKLLVLEVMGHLVSYYRSNSPNMKESVGQEAGGVDREESHA